MKTQELGPSLVKALSEVPDPRSRHGRRHPLPAVLTLAVVGMLSGARSLYAMAQWGREQPESVVRALGFTRGRTPGVATLHRVFKALDIDAFETVLARWARTALGDRGEAIAIDGKALRGIHGEELPGVRLVAAYEVQTGLVLAQGGGEAQTGAASRPVGGRGSNGRGGGVGRGKSASRTERRAAGAADDAAARTAGDR
ncbi:MAG: transposase family protein [Ktedonobacterales bacterium]